MATILLAATGAAVGAGFGGTVLGLSGAVIGRAVGATVGRMIDQRLMGAGFDAVDVGRVDRFRLMGASEGTAIGQVYGRARVSGQVIWASRFLEGTKRSGGGKGSPKPKTTEFSYSVSLAVALCEGEITRVGRIWADGIEVARDTLNMRVYPGSEEQLPDAKIEAVEGVGKSPAYRGTAYVVFEDLALGPFGNRVPQFSFEVVRAAQGEHADTAMNLGRAINGVALIPGTGEYALATTPVHMADGLGVNRSVNINTASGKTDFATSLEQMREELPACRSVSLVVSWFGSDLRCGECTVRPKVEQNVQDAVGYPWRVGMIDRASADQVPQIDDRPIYGGTPSDRSVIEAIQAIRAGGQEVMFYPFILMDQLAGNGLPDPWTGAADQPALPWRGRITLAKAPGKDLSSDQTILAENEVSDFFGTAQATDFTLETGLLSFSGPAEWRYRRFILHYAHLCAAAGGVDAFCIGSEMRGLTQIRGAGDSFPTVQALRSLAADCRAILGPDVKISYAADWSEYFGYHPDDGDLYFHLDPLWADTNIDFVGIDNYMPISDWRDGDTHSDAAWGTINNLEYLRANIAGGEGYDWFYSSLEHDVAQIRTPITDGAFNEPWVYRYKDLRSWWSMPHHERKTGARSTSPTAWLPMSKPIRFTELGCAAIDKGTNQPNRFLDPKSSESGLPRYSDGSRDDLIQMQYLRAVAMHFGEEDNNPLSAIYAGPMVDMALSHVWAWDARPFPAFPNAKELWSDAANYARGHWLNGRTSSQPLASVVAEICERSNLHTFDVSRLMGVVRGYQVDDVTTARSALQPLMLAYGFEAVERAGILQFKMRNGRALSGLQVSQMALSDELDGVLETSRLAEAESVGTVRLGYVASEGDYDVRSAEAVFPDDISLSLSQSELALALTQPEAQGIAERWLTEARVARDTARFALPPSQLHIGAGDVVALNSGLFRIDRVEQRGQQLIEAVRVEPSVYQPSDGADETITPRAFSAPVPVFPLFLDLPLLTGDEVAHAPHIAVTATPWPGSVAVWNSATDDGYELNRLLGASSIIGVTRSPLEAAKPGVWDRGAPLLVEVYGGTLSAVTQMDVLNGANVMAIGDGSSDGWEIFQFETADLIGPGTYALGNRLRGQLGTDATLTESWPVGSYVVLLDKGPQQIDIPFSARGLARHYRIGTGLRGYDDPAVVHRLDAFQGIGLRPYSPAHLAASLDANGDIGVQWIRRTRIDGDSWQSFDVPLGEATEQYLLRVTKAGTVLREVTLATPNWIYPQVLRVADGATAGFQVEVAQVSDRFGAGPFTRIEWND